MKKCKRILSIITALALAAVLAGCSDDEDSNSSADAAETEQTEYVMQDGDYQVTGEVSSIVGNEVTLDLGEVEESEASQIDFGETSESDGETDEMSGEMPEMSGEMPEMGGEMPEMGGEMPDMSGMDGGKGGMRNGGEQKSSYEITKSGESGVYLIPYGMTVTGNGRSGDYSSITEGTLLRLTITADGYVAAAEIL
ncbi:MAG: hypothetical protein LUI05_09865 [Oscillospiraceae bacterium]|nr:hypothetical protein [Oscillospiraceae bacterium]